MAPKSSRSARSQRPAWAGELAAEVRGRRKLLRLTQKQLADLSGCGTDFLYDLEQGKHTLRLDKLVAVLTALGVQLRLEQGPSGLVARAGGSTLEPLEGPKGQG